MIKHRYRCSNRRGCHKRVTLRKRKELYVKEPVCKSCGSPLTSVEKARKAETKKNNCYCDGLPFTPHRSGSKWCNYYTGEYSEEDLRERHLV